MEIINHHDLRMFRTYAEEQAELAGEFENPDQRNPQCNRCGSRDVRWRQQGGRWVLFSLQPGREHVCDLSADGFEAVPE